MELAVYTAVTSAALKTPAEGSHGKGASMQAPHISALERETFSTLKASHHASRFWKIPEGD